MSAHTQIVHQIFRQIRRFDAGILCVLQGKSTPYDGKDGVQAVRVETLIRLSYCAKAGAAQSEVWELIVQDRPATSVTIPQDTAIVKQNF